MVKVVTGKEVVDLVETNDDMLPIFQPVVYRTPPHVQFLPHFKIYLYMHSHLFALIVPIAHCSKNMHSAFHLGWTFQSSPHFDLSQR
jgi:hypothetical protein